MGHITLECIQKCRAALDELSVEEHGIDGPRLLLYGEGWEFGEIEGGARGATACQRQLAGTGIGSFNDNLRGAVLGGNAFEDPRLQGFATGLGLREPSDVALKTTTSELELLVAFGRDIWREDPHTPGIYEYKDTKDYRGPQRVVDKQDLRIAADILRVCLAAGLRQFRLEQDCLGKRNVLASQVHGGKAAYVSSPEEVVNFICVHDNETLYDSTIWKMSPETTDPEERMRANWLCSATLALGHGVPLFHAGDEVLRSKSLDRDSYNSGDWFNLLDYSGETSAFGAGLPPWGKNHTKWELMKPLLRDDRLRPNKEMVAATTAKFCELLGIRKSTALLGLREAADIVDKVHFPGCGLGQIPGVVVMEVRNGTSSASGTPLCDKYSRVVVVFSARPDEVRIPAPTSRSGGMLMLHPLQVASADTRTREARYDEATDELVVPALTAAVFVEPQPNQPSFKASERRAQFRPALRERPIVGDGMGLVAADPACVPFKGHFEYRWKVYTDLRKHISETSGSLTEFASGFRKLGFTKDEASGAITYREWLPPAKAVSLVGDFNNWDEGATPLARDAFGTWEVTLPAKSIAHRTKVKFCATTPDGSKVYRVPAWIRWSCPDLGKFGSTYDGYYWDPSEDVLSPDELAIVVQNYRDGGLNAQPETPEKEEAPRKKGSLLEWEHPSKVGLINRRSLMLNWKVTRFFEEIEDHRLKAIFDEVAKSWPPKIRSRKTLVVAEEDGEIEDEQEEEEEEEQQLTEDDEEDGQPAEVDGYLAQSLGIVPGSPAPPASAYVATVAYELSDEGPPVPYAAALPNGDDDTDLVRQLAELEQQIAHRRAALSGRQAIERWHSLQHMDSQRTIAWPETLQEFVAEQPAPLSSATEGGYFRQGASSNLSLGHVEAKDVAPCNVPVATPARAASVAPAVSEDLADPTDVAVAPGVSEDLADPTKAAVAPGVSEDLADKAAVAPGVSEDLADKAPVAPGVSEDLAEPAVAPGVSQDLADPAQLAVAPGVLKDLADRAVAPGVLKDLADPVAPRVSDDLGEATPATPRPESVSLEIASSSQPPSPELLALKVQTRRAEQMRGREGGTQEDVPVFKRPAAKGWPKGKAKARPAKGELLDDEPTKRAKKGQQGDDEPKKRATKGEQGDDEPKPKRATKGEQQGDEPKPKRAKKGEQGDEPKPKRATKGEQGDEPKPKRAKKGEQQGEEEPKPKRAKKGKQGDDEPKRAKKGEQQGDDEPKRAKKGKQGDEPKRAQKGKQGDEPKRAQKGKQGDEEPKPKPAKKGKQGDEPKPLKKTFAKRWEPEVEGRSKCLWTSIRDAFNDLIRPQLRFPTKFEDPFWMHCRPKLIELEEATAKDTKRCINQMQTPTQPEEKRRQAPNEERDCHRLFNRWGLSLPVPITEKTFVLDDREKAETAYIRVQDWLLYLLKRNRSLLAGGNDSLEFQLEAYWMAYRQTHSTHPVFGRGLDLGTTIPLAFYSDEGKGPKRGNFVVVAIESPIGLMDVADDFTCTCQEDVKKAPQQFVPGQQAAGPYTPMEEAALKQNTTCKGHSYLTRHVLFGLPDWIYKHHPEVLEKMTQQVADELTTLFSSGLEINGKVYTACLVGIKGDLKQIAEKIAYLNRYYARLGPVSYNGVCAHCMAGTVPHDDDAPERVLKYDMFHLYKVGLGRDICGSLVLLARLGYYDDPNGGDETNLRARLIRCFQHFRLWRLAAGKSAAVRYFSASLFNLKRLSDFAWSNTKGSDTMLLLEYLSFYLTILLRRPNLPAAHAVMFRVLKKTIGESQKAFNLMYKHGLWLRRTCAQNLYLRLMSVLSGYQHLAQHALTMGMTFFALKPKYHAIHHVAYELRVALLTEAKLIPNPITWNCEMGEDLIGRICALSLKVSVTTINKRVLQRHFLKKAALIRRHRQDRSKRKMRL
ncbi:PU1 [Symbiodinium microadriaticum]|nr:PU1 [Symbiodinium microadriaticum]